MNLMNLMKQAQVMMPKIQEMGKAFERSEFTGEAGDGVVQVTVNGMGRFKSIKVSPQITSLDTETIEDVISTAMSKATKKASEFMEKNMKSMTGGIGIPGLF